MNALNVGMSVIVAGNGFYSQNNMRDFSDKHSKFLMETIATDRWGREEIDAAWTAREHFDCACSFDIYVRGVMCRRQLFFLHRATANARGVSMRPSAGGSTSTFSIYLRRLWNWDVISTSNLRP